MTSLLRILANTSTVVFQNQYALVKWNETYKTLSVDWQGNITKEAFIETIIVAMHFMNEYATQTFISDRSAVTSFWLRADDWLSVHFGPTIKRDKVKRFAFIMPQSESEQRNAQKAVLTLKQLHPEVTIQLFPDLEKAYKWAYPFAPVQLPKSVI